MRPWELELEIRRIGEQHPQAEVLVCAPSCDSDSYDNQLCKITGVSYEQKMAFYDGETYFDPRDLYEAHPELKHNGVDYFSGPGYILIDCAE